MSTMFEYATDQLPVYGDHCGRLVYKNSTMITPVIRTAAAIRLSLCPMGFCSSKIAAIKWTKSGHLSLSIPGHDPPFKITIF